MATSFLPFLYPARLVQRPLRAPVVRQFLRSIHATAPRANDGSQRSSTSSKANRRVQNIHSDHIPFDLPADYEPDALDAAEIDGHIRIGTGNPDDGTITPLERQAFRRIFRTLARRKPALKAEDHAAVDTTDAVEEAATADAAEKHLYSRIHSIVGGASDEQVYVREAQRNKMQENASLPGLATRGESQRDRILAQFPASLRAAAGKALGINDDTARPPKPEVILDEAVEVEEDADDMEDDERAASQQARRERQTSMELAMLSKKTDTALWQYMEEHVFALVDQWGLRATVGKRAARRTRALADDRPLYPALLLHGQRLLESHFAGGTVSPLALAVVPRIKQLGLASYVLGASTPLYNHLLHLRWRRQGNAPAVFALLREMQRAGLPFNAATLAVVKSVEWHVAPLTRNAMNVDVGDVVEENAVAAAAVQQLPDLATVAGQAAYWRQQIERTVNRRAVR